MNNKNIIKGIIFSSLLALCFQNGNSQTILQGVLSEEHNGMTLPFATVVIFKDGNILTGTDTNFNGEYIFTDIDPGTYDVVAFFIGFATNQKTGIIIQRDAITKLNFEMIEEEIICFPSHYHELSPPLISFDNTTSGTIMNQSDIRRKQF